ncbi:hypothetical protein BGS_0269 [Beggiatoa sp. SS]|nr:hypothetical protein BGS_0269 [Beggiatoa sp. SS]
MPVPALPLGKSGMTKTQNVTATFDLLNVNQYKLTGSQTGTG